MKTFIVILIIVLAAVGAYWLFSDQEEEMPEENNGTMLEGDNGDAMMDGEDGEMEGNNGGAMDNEDGTGADSSGEEPSTPETVTIRFDGSAFVPSSVTISQGDSVTWVNDSETPTWPASAQHPTHTAYPTEGGCIGSSFDACRGLEQGETFTFTFEEIGTWNFHDHLNSTIFGRVTVSE